MVLITCTDHCPKNNQDASTIFRTSCYPIYKLTVDISVNTQKLDMVQ